MKVEYHPSTITDLNRAVDFYERQRIGLGRLGGELRDAIHKTIARIASNPLIYRPIAGQIRRCFAHRFPFSILYRVVDDDLVRVLVIRHHRQHPQFGTGRR